jgi:glycosyltransferase involved in cell wall biosynthesis
MNILIGSSSFPGEGRGISTYVNDLIILLKNKGHKVFLASPASRKCVLFSYFFLSDQFVDPKVNAEELYELILFNSIEFVINNDNPILQSLAPLLKVKFFSVAHMNKTSVAKLATSNFLWVDKVITISTDMTAEIKKKYNVPDEKILQLLNSTPTQDVNWDMKVNTDIKVVYAGGSNENKGFKYVFEVLQKLNTKNNSRMCFHLFGYYTNNDIYKLNMLQNLKITLHGSVSRDILLECFSESHVLLFPSLNEGCPITILEAMSFGLMTITSNGIGGMKDLVFPGINGYIKEFKNWGLQVPNLLDKLSIERSNLERLMKNSHQTHQSMFSPQNFYEQLFNEHEYIKPPLKKSSKIYRWHRTVNVKTGNASIIDSLCLKFEILRTAGVLKV